MRRNSTLHARPPFGALLAIIHLFAATALATDRDTEGTPSLEPPQVIARDASGGVTVRAIRIPEPLIVDGILSDDYYRDTPAIDGFVQQEPHEGAPATEKTEAWIFAASDRAHRIHRTDTRPTNPEASQRLLEFLEIL